MAKATQTTKTTTRSGRRRKTGGNSGYRQCNMCHGTWVEATEVYKKVNGVWAKQTDLTNVFDTGTNYVKGE